MKERNCLVDRGIELWVILECTVKELVRWIWTGFIGNRTQDRFEIFEHAKRRLSFHKVLGVPSVPEKQFA